MRFVTALVRGEVALSERVATVLVVISGVSAASIAFFARSLTEAGLAAGAVVFYRFAATVAITGRTALLGRSVTTIGDRQTALRWAFGAGLALGLGWVAYVLAIEQLDVAAVGVIYMTYPVFALVAGWVLVRARPAGRGVFGAVLVSVGAAIAVGSTSIGLSRGIVLLAFVAPVSFGLVVAVLSERVQTLKPVERIAATSLGGFAAMIPVVVTQPIDSVIPGDGRTWLLVVAIGLVTSLLPMGSFILGAPVVGSARAAIAGTVELPTVFVIAWLLLDEPPTSAQLVGGAIIIAAAVVSPTRPPPIATARPRPRRRRRRRTRLTDPPGTLGSGGGASDGTLST